MPGLIWLKQKQKQALQTRCASMDVLGKAVKLTNESSVEGLERYVTKMAHYAAVSGHVSLLVLFCSCS